MIGTKHFERELPIFLFKRNLYLKMLLKLTLRENMQSNKSTLWQNLVKIQRINLMS